MVWHGANYPAEHPTPEDDDGPADDVLELREQVADLTARVLALEERLNSITIGPGGALYG